MTQLELDRSQRWLLANQYRILELLSKDDSVARVFRERYEALEQGYEAHYADAAMHILPEELTTAQCREVLSILAMYDAMSSFSGGVDERDQCDPADLVFGGFDSKTETRLWAYTKYLCGLSSGQFARFGSDCSLDSGQPMLSRYRRMLAVWNGLLRRRQRLAKADLRKLLEAGRDS